MDRVDDDMRFTGIFEGSLSQKVSVMFLLDVLLELDVDAVQEAGGYKNGSPTATKTIRAENSREEALTRY